MHLSPCVLARHLAERSFSPRHCWVLTNRRIEVSLVAGIKRTARLAHLGSGDATYTMSGASLAHCKRICQNGCSRANRYLKLGGAAPTTTVFCLKGRDAPRRRAPRLKPRRPPRRKTPGNSRGDAALHRSQPRPAADQTGRVVRVLRGVGQRQPTGRRRHDGLGEHAPARVLDELDAERVQGFQRVTRSFSSRGAAERRDDADGVVLPLVCDI